VDVERNIAINVVADPAAKVMQKDQPTTAVRIPAAIGDALRCRLRSCAQFMSVRITKISDEGPVRALIRWALDRCAAVRNTGVVPRQNMLAAQGGDSDCPAIGNGRRLAVDRFRDHQSSAFVDVNQSASRIHLAGPAAQCSERGVVEVS